MLEAAGRHSVESITEVKQSWLGQYYAGIK